MSTASNLQKQDVACARGAKARRWGALLGGGALAVYGITRRSLSGLAMAGAGGALAYVGAKTNGRPKVIAAHTTMLLNCSPQDAYQFWHKFEELPRFMRHVESVTQVGERRYRWVALGPLGSRVSWDAEIVTDRPSETIAWHSLPGSDVQVEGWVDFRNAPANRGTLVEVTLRMRPIAGAARHGLSELFGKYPDFLLRQDLRRFKAVVETGEIPTTEGQPHGRAQ